MDFYNADTWDFLILILICGFAFWLMNPNGFDLFNQKKEVGMEKFEFLLEEDQGYVLHNESPKCKAKLGDDDDLFDEINWLDLANEAEKQSVVEKMKEWYWHDFQKIS